MRSLGLIALLAALIVPAAVFSNETVRAEEPAETAVMEEAGLGSVYLRNEKVENIDKACLGAAVKELVAAIDGHRVSYLKMMIYGDDDSVAEMKAGPHIFIRRDAVQANDALVSLEKGEPYFLGIVGKALYSAGVMPGGIDFGKCLKTDR
jgi:hypothetical protein